MISKEEKKNFKFRENYPFILENVTDLVCIIEPNDAFKFEFINKTFLNVLSYKNNDLIGKSLLDYIYPEDVKKVIKILKRDIEFGSHLHEIRIKSKNDMYIWVKLKVKKFKDDNKQKKLLLILNDISDRKELEYKISESENKFKMLSNSIPEIRFWKLFYPKKYEEALQLSYEMLQIVMENIPQYIFWKDTDLVYLGCNNNYAKFIDAELPENVIGETDNDLLYNHEKATQLQKQEAYIMKSNKPEHHKVEPWILKDGKQIWLDVNRIPLHDSKGKILGILVTYNDITELKKAEQKLKESEEKFRTITEQSIMGILEIDLLTTKISYVNPKLLEMIGHKIDDLKGKSGFTKFIHPEDLKNFYNLPEKKELEFRVFDKDGKLKWLSGNTINYFNEKGELQSFRLWLEDVTEKKLYEKLIYELNINFLNFTADIQKNIEMLLQTCCLILDADVVLHAYKRLHNGKEQYQIISSDKKNYFYDSEKFKERLFISELFKETHDYTQTILNIGKTKYANTDPYIIEYKVKACYGKLIKSQNEFNGCICAFYHENPMILHQHKLLLFLICDAIEIEQKRWEVQQHLEEQNRMLNEINKFKSELFTRTSHELKTPLISIKGFTELLLKVHNSKLDTDMILSLEEIQRGSMRLERIVNSLLKSSELDQGHLKLNYTDEDLTFLINFCVKEFKGLIDLRNLTINLDIHKSLKSSFDKERIYDVVSNLLMNAIKYTPPDGEITIQSKIKDNFYIISFEDNGIGLTEEEKSQLFKQFGKIERYGKGWDVGIEGSGFGLYISKKIVELHGGKIWVESEGRSKGSKFYFSLPIISE